MLAKRKPGDPRPFVDPDGVDGTTRDRSVSAGLLFSLVRPQRNMAMPP
jgi:hypothetical protein